MYLHGKQTIAQISETTGLSASTVTRRLASISFSWEQPRIKGSGVIHLDATYFGRNTGVLLALESGSGRLLYMKHIAHEHISDYEDAVKHIVGCAAIVFSRRPPIGSTLPRSVISPVIATSLRTGIPDRADTRAVVIVTPAEGPS
ncbi:hypothetical protein OBE_15253, partial [human gut metagenome]